MPFTVELGGKGPPVVFANCDLEAAPPSRPRAQYEDAGQVCLAGTAFWWRQRSATSSGIVWTNTFLVRDIATTFGGCGREGGDHALDFHSDFKTLILADNTTG